MCPWLVMGGGDYSCMCVFILPSLLIFRMLCLDYFRSVTVILGVFYVCVGYDLCDICVTQ